MSLQIALKAISDGYPYSIEGSRVEDIHGAGYTLIHVVVENPLYEPDNGRDPNLVFEVKNAAS